MIHTFSDAQMRKHNQDVKLSYLKGLRKVHLMTTDANGRSVLVTGEVIELEEWSDMHLSVYCKISTHEERTIKQDDTFQRTHLIRDRQDSDNQSCPCCYG
jgi:hypothetical protein